MAINRIPDQRARERRIYIAAAIAFPLIVLAGFARTYYLKGLFGMPPTTTLVHLHGISMTAWVLLFVTQTYLISSRRVKLHQKLGYAGIGAAVVVFVVGFLTAVNAAKYGSPSTPPDIPPQAFLIVPLFDILMFAVFFGAAVYLRKKPAEHKRLMLLTAINFLPPAVARIPVESLQSLGPLWFFGFPTVLTIGLIAFDRWQSGKLNRIFLAGGLLLIGSYVFRLALMGSDAWLGVAGWLTSFVP